MKRIIARTLYYFGCISAVALTAFLVSGIGWAYILDIRAGNWWVLPLALLGVLAVFALAVGIAAIAMWVDDNK